MMNVKAMPSTSALIAAILVLGTYSATSIANAPTTQISDQAYADHIKDLKSRLPADFSLTIQKPFIVITDDTPENLKRYATGTVKWAVDHLKKDYFTKDPDELID